MEEKKGIYSIAHEETYKSGQVIFKEDSPENKLYIVLSGSVETFKSVEGSEFIIESLESGDLLGEIEFFGAMPRTVTARAVGKTVLGVIDEDLIKDEYGQLSKQFKSILKSIPARLKKIIDRTCDISG